MFKKIREMHISKKMMLGGGVTYGVGVAGMFTLAGTKAAILPVLVASVGAGVFTGGLVHGIISGFQEGVKEEERAQKLVSK